MPRLPRAPAVFHDAGRSLPEVRTATAPTDLTSAARSETFSDTAARIQACALAGETTVVRRGPIVLFCAQGDAWMLDPVAGTARCLAKTGEGLALGIVECGMQFRVRWNATYWIEGDDFNVQQFGADQPLTIEGYPTQEITSLIPEPFRN